MNISLWDKNAPDSDSQLQKMLVMGRYRMTFYVPLVDCSGLATEESSMMSACGKAIMLEKIVVPPTDTHTVYAYVNLLENPIPLAVIIPVVAGIGVIGIIFLTKVERIVSAVTPLLLVGGSYWAWKQLS